MRGKMRTSQFWYLMAATYRLAGNNTKAIRDLEGLVDVTEP